MALEKQRNNYKTKMAANFDNQVSAFLVNFCNESSELSSVQVDLYWAYYQLYLKQTLKLDTISAYSKAMDQSSFAKRLVAAGLESTLEVIPNRFNGQRVRIIKGVALKQQPIVQKPEPSQSREATRIRAEELGNGHIEINGTLYARELISTLKPIRGFVRFDSKTEMKAIVTFRNPELRHQFLSAEEAKRIKQILGESK